MLSKTVSWKYPCGIELTFVPFDLIPEMDADTSHEGWREAAMVLRNRLARAKKFHWLYHPEAYTAVHNDPGCVEAPTKVLYSWEEAELAWHTIVGYARELCLVPRHPQQQSGMGHVHIDCSIEAAYWLVRDLATRPFVAWTLVNPNAVKYCQGYVDIARILDLEFSIWDRGPSRGMPTFKRHTLTWRHSHVEWRAFEAARNWAEQEAHLAFLQRYIEYGHQLVGQATIKPYNLENMAQAYREMYAYDLDACVKGWKELITMLDLPWGRYKRYVDENLAASFEWGGPHLRI